MGYVSTGATRGGAVPIKLMQDLACGAGKEWVPPVGKTGGYCRRKTSDRGTQATVHEQPADDIRAKCGKWGFGSEKALICEQWLRAGNPEAQLPSVFACIDKGYTGQSLEICIDGRKNGIAFSEIDAVIAELAANASASQQAAIAQEQALVASRKRRNLLIIGGLGTAAVAGFIIWKKRSKKRTAK